MIKEMFDSFKDAAKERIKSPLLGAFAIAWLITNWELVLTLLFSNKEIEEVITNDAPLISNYYNMSFGHLAPSNQLNYTRLKL